MSFFTVDGRSYDLEGFDAEALKEAVGILRRAGIEGAVAEARRLWAASFAPDHGTGGAFADRVQYDHFIEMAKRRARGAPMSHILGRRDFYDLTFRVTPDVLDPRPDTETLVEAALEVPFEQVLDLGTGSGCILVSLLAARRAATGLGVDLSDATLKVALRNADANGVATRSDWRRSDWFGEVQGRFDLIVSNPPYIAEDEMAGLSAEVLHEPRMALTDGGDGLSCYRVIAAGAPEYLNAGGWLMVEIGPTQGAVVTGMFEAAGLTKVSIRPDLDGRDRVVLGQKPL